MSPAPDGHKSRLLRPEGDDPVPTRLPLKAIRTGPLLVAEQRNTLRGFLERHEMGKIEITHSAVPLR
jgi:hypothetical protein